MAKKHQILTLVEYNSQLQNAYAALEEAHAADYEARKHEVDCKNQLDAAATAVVLRYASDPAALGKNEDQRKAKTAELTKAERELHVSAVKAVAETAYRQAKAYREVQRLRDTIGLFNACGAIANIVTSEC